LPQFLWPQVPLTFETPTVIFPYSLALIGLLESLMTATIVDDLTDTNSNKIANVWAKELPISVQVYSAVWPVVP